MDRSANGQCPILTHTLTLGGASGAPHIVYPAGDHNAFFVGIPKCASNTFVSGSVHKAFGGVNLGHDKNYSSQSFLGFRPLPGAPTSYFSIVRDPLQRFLSAYYELHHKRSFGCVAARPGCWVNAGMPPYSKSSELPLKSR